MVVYLTLCKALKNKTNIFAASENHPEDVESRQVSGCSLWRVLIVYSSSIKIEAQ